MHSPLMRPPPPARLLVMPWLRLVVALSLRCLRHPTLVIDLARVAWRMRARGWYTRLPFLPVPSPAYVAWRMYTAYGDEHAVPPPDDVERYARWVGRGP